MDAYSLGATRERGGRAALPTRHASPITYAAQVRTPTLLITGLADQVVKFTESWAFYHALRDNHVPVRLIGLPTALSRRPIRYAPKAGIAVRS